MSRRTVKNIKSVFWYIGALIISLITVYPFLWMIATSFKPEAEIYSSSLSLFQKTFRWLITPRCLIRYLSAGIL